MAAPAADTVRLHVLVAEEGSPLLAYMSAPSAFVAPGDNLDLCHGPSDSELTQLGRACAPPAAAGTDCTTGKLDFVDGRGCPALLRGGMHVIRYYSQRAGTVTHRFFVGVSEPMPATAEGQVSAASARTLHERLLHTLEDALRLRESIDGETRERLALAEQYYRNQEAHIAGLISVENQIDALEQRSSSVGADHAPASPGALDDGAPSAVSEPGKAWPPPDGAMPGSASANAAALHPDARLATDAGGVGAAPDALSALETLRRMEQELDALQRRLAATEAQIANLTAERRMYDAAGAKAASRLQAVQQILADMEERKA